MGSAALLQCHSRLHGAVSRPHGGPPRPAGAGQGCRDVLRGSVREAAHWAISDGRGSAGGPWNERPRGVQLLDQRRSPRRGTDDGAGLRGGHHCAPAHQPLDTDCLSARAPDVIEGRGQARGSGAGGES
eukprot:scaffold331_cov243-Pinguiococcus_pyrenoidosus.AAC.7